MNETGTAQPSQNANGRTSVKAFAYESIAGPGQLKQDDLVIAIMGTTGSGKSRIIDILTGRPDPGSGSALESQTQEATAVRIIGHPLHENRLVFLDTPGFDDTKRTDLQILQIIADWLVKSYQNGVQLAGILYLHRITDNRMAGAPYRNLKMFGELCGDKAARGVVLVTTMWDKLRNPEVGVTREDDLKKNFWADLIKSSASVDRFENTFESACGIIDSLVLDRREGVTLLLQEEMVELEKTLSETRVGQALYDDLQRLLFQQREILRDLAKHAAKQSDREQAAQINERYHEVQTQVEELYEQVQNLHVSFGRKIVLFFTKRSAARPLQSPRRF